MVWRFLKVAGIALTVTVVLAVTGLAVLLITMTPTDFSQRKAQASDTQVVVQWEMAGEPGLWAGLLATYRQSRAEKRIAEAAGTLYSYDGNDIGGGTFNIFLYTDKVEATISSIVALEAAGDIPPGVRIGYAVYKDEAHKDWEYKPAHPPGLNDFDIMGPDIKAFLAKRKELEGAHPPKP